MSSKNTSIAISGSGLFTPSQNISNDELVQAFNAYVALYNERHKAEISTGEMDALQDSSSAFIEKASGIKSRFVLDKTGVLDPERMYPYLQERDDEQLSIQAEMAVKAAQQALRNANKTQHDIDAVIVACSNLQRAYPAVAIEVQSALGIDGFAYDMNVACSSATFALQTAYDAVANGNARSVLVLNPEICSSHLEWRDRDCHFIFGDACTAMIVEPEKTITGDSAFRILGTQLKTQFSNNIRNNLGFLTRTHDKNPDDRDLLFCQNGRKVFKEVCPMVAQLIQQHLEQLSLQSGDIKRLWLHQANLSMNELIGKRVLGYAPSREESPVILDQYANTSSAGSVISFHLHNQDLVAGDKGVICSFGAGYSIGSVVLEKI